MVPLRLPRPVGVGQVGMRETRVVLHRRAMIARVLQLPAAGAPIGHAATIVAPVPDVTTKPALRRMPIERRELSTVLALFAN